jgi:monoamine oxidase
MKNTALDVIIIGAGLSGLCLAYFLKNRNYRIKILEGRSRIGGRILTTFEKETSIEMGATWFSPQHTELQKLIQELGLEIFEQELGKMAIYEPISKSPHQVVTLPAHQEPSYRIKGGTFSLIQALKKGMGDVELDHDCIVNSIEQEGENLLVSTNQGNFKAKKVVSTLPPFLFKNSISVIPALPSVFVDVAQKTHTWMGESIKIGVSYTKSFWKENGLSGTIFSNPGPIPEMYDHSNAENSKFALKGFLNGAYFSITKEQRLELILNQLEKYYGPQVREYLDYQELIWQNESLTYTPYDDQLFPHQNNGNEVFRKSYLNNNLFISGSETSKFFPGYMEGAVRSSQWVSERL